MSPASPPDDVNASELSHDLQVAVMKLARRLRAQRKDLGLTLSQLSVLALLGRGGPMTLGELAASEQVQPPSMTRTVSALVGLGLVSRSASEKDGRAFVIALTPDGVSLLATDRARREAWLAQRLESLSPQELAAVQAALPVLSRLAGP